MRTVIAAWNFPPEEMGRLRWIAHELGAEALFAGAAEADQPLRQVLSSAPKHAAEEEAALFPETLLVLSGFTEGQLDRFLAAYRTAGLPKAAYKAVLTPTNRRWTAARLMEDLRAERAALSGEE